MQTFLLIDPATGRGLGASRTAAPGYVPGEAEVPCTDDQAATPTAWTLVDGVLIAAPPTLDGPDDLAAYASQVRFARETAGIEVGGERIDTSRESQSLITGAHALALAEPDEAIDFKSSTGWVAIDSAAMILIALAVARHVRACFRAERAVAAAIAAGTITTRAEIDAAFAA